MIINKYSSFIFDLDGTIYLDNDLIKGAKKVIDYLNNENKRFVFLTNKPLATRKEYAKKLNNLGVSTTPENIITSSFVTAQYLKETSPQANCYVIGESALKSELKKAGLKVKDNPNNIDYLIASFDRNFDYKKLNDSLQIIKNGAKFIATNPDKTCPVKNGEIPDAAGMIGAIEGTTGKKVEKILGKPSKIIIEIALKKMHVKNPQDCLIVGDRLETDIKMGIENNLQTALVLSGVTNKKYLKNNSIKPKFILKNISELFNCPEEQYYE